MSDQPCAPYFEQGINLYGMISHPLGIHYTSSARIPDIMEHGIDAPEGHVGRNYFVVFKPSVRDNRLKHDPAMRRVRNRNIRYAMWLSHFALEKVERDASTPSLVLAYVGDIARRGDRPSESYLSFVGRVYTDDCVFPPRIITHVELGEEEYERLKSAYGNRDNCMTIGQFMSKEVMETDLPTAVSARLFRELYRQFMFGRF